MRECTMIQQSSGVVCFCSSDEETIGPAVSSIVTSTPTLSTRHDARIQAEYLSINYHPIKNNPPPPTDQPDQKSGEAAETSPTPHRPNSDGRILSP